VDQLGVHGIDLALQLGGESEGKAARSATLERFVQFARGQSPG
jgi:hypothetical protein